VASRDPWLDNTKMALVTLVVVGHAWTVLPDTDLNEHLYDFLYVWHVPAFVLVTGYLSRSFTWTRRRLIGLVTTVAVPYVIFEALMAAFRIRFGDERFEDLFLDPHWPMWYLAALFWWRLLTPVLKSHPAMIPATVAVSVLAGTFAGDTFDVARVLGLLPFFTVGLHLSGERLARVRSGWVRVVGIGALALAFVLSARLDRWIETEWLYYRARYEELSASDLESMVIRLVLLAVGGACAVGFMSLVPRTDGWFARAGVWTLVVYLYHGFVVKTVAYAGFGGWAEGYPFLSLLVITAGAVATALLLAWDPVARRLNVMVDPYGEIRRRGPATPTGPSQPVG
jgi:fucose 4-O-acetylase-like acetyltransferase